MSDRTTYETGSRKLEPATGPDPRDDFSQDAAKNRKPANGLGLSEDVDVERSEEDKSDLRDTPEGDAAGQSEKNHAGGGNNGMSSADPRVFSGDNDGDATFPLKQDR